MASPRKRFFKKSKNLEPIEQKKAGGKQKNSSKKEVKQGVVIQFPKIYRFIPDFTSRAFHRISSFKDYLKLKWILLYLFIIVGVVWNVWIGSVFFKDFSTWSHLLLAREILYNQMATWENIAQKYPNYRDAYVEGAMLAYRLGDKQKESYFLHNLQLLDPNFPLTKTYQQLTQLQALNQ